MVYDYLLLRLQNNRIQIRILCIPECIIYNLKSRFSTLGNNTLGNNCSILILEFYPNLCRLVKCCCKIYPCNV